MIKKFLISALMVFANRGAAFAAAGETTATFLTLGVGGRPTAMGEAYTGIAEGVNAWAYNPAGVAYLDAVEVSVMHAEWLADSRYEFLAFAYPTSWGSVGGAARAFSAGGIEARSDPDNPSPQPEGTFTAMDVALDLGYAYPFSAKIALGLNLKGISQKLYDVQRYGVAGDVGAYWAPWSTLSVGFAGRNLGPPVRFEEESSPLPMAGELGLGYRLWGRTVVLGAAAEKPFKDDFLYKGGLEYNAFEFLAVRAGYLGGLDTGGLSGLTGGVGVIAAGFTFDFTYAPYGDLGATYRGGFTYAFGRERRRIVSEVTAAKEKEFDKQKREMIAALSANAQSYSDAGDYAAAVDTWDLILVWDPDNKDAAAKMELAGDRLNQIQLEEHLGRAEAFFTAGKYSEAALEYNFAQKVDPTNAAAIAGFARAQEKLAQEEAKQAERVAALMERARAAYSRGDYGTAINKWEEVLLVAPGNAEAKERLVDARARVAGVVDDLKADARRNEDAGNWSAAAKGWDRALELSSRDEEATAGRARARAAVSREAGALVEDGIALYERGDVNGAEAKFLAALNIQPDESRAASYLDRIKEKRAGTKRTATDYSAVYLKGIQAYTNHQYRAAIAYWEQIPAGDPLYAKAVTNIKRAKAVLRELEEK